MSSFTQSLQDASIRDNTRAYWVLKLYYGDETNFTGISNLPRERGGDKYYGLELGWQGLNQRGDPDNFFVSDITLSITIANTINSIEGVRFSDLYGSREYANRKWELIQCDENADYSDTNIIASGTISDKTPKADELSCTIYLDDWWERFNVEMPPVKAIKTDYPYLPEKNIGKPKPAFWGNLLHSSATWRQNPEFAKVKVPALIIDGWEDDNAGVRAAIDHQAISDFKDLFLYKNDQWIYSAGTITENLPEISFIGNTWKTYYPLAAHDTPVTSGTVDDYTDGFDMDVDSNLTWNVTGGGGGRYLQFRIPDKMFNKLGATIQTVNLKIFGNFPFSIAASFFIHVDGDSKSVGHPGLGVQEGIFDITSLFSSTELETWQLDSQVIKIEFTPTDTIAWDMYEVGLELVFAPDKQYTKYIDFSKPNDLIIERKHLHLTGNILGQYRASIQQIGDIEAVYINGKGRVYGSWIESGRSNGYSTGVLIENPVYIIEDIIRNVETKLGLSAGSLVNTTFFDTAGNTSNGTIGNVFNTSVTNIKFAFSVYDFIFTKQLIRNICRLSGLYFYWSKGKAKVIARKRSYTSVDRTIDYSEIAYPDSKNRIPLPSAMWTPLQDVINKLTVKYQHDYGTNQTVESLIPGTDTGEYSTLENIASQTKYNQVFDADLPFRYTWDLNTALNYGIAKISYLKDRKRKFECQMNKATHNDIEFGEIINITNFPTSYQVYGETITSAMPWMVIGFDKLPAFPRLKLMRVPGSV